MKRKTLLALTCFCCLVFIKQTWGQGNKADSLVALLKTSKEDTNKVNTILALYTEIWYKQPVEALQYAHEALSLAEKLLFINGAANANRMVGLSLYFTGDFDSSRIYYNTSLDLSEQSGDQIGKARTLMNIASIEQSQGRFENALSFDQQSLDILIRSGNKQLIAKVYNNIGNIHNSLNNLDKALEYFFKSLALKKEIDDKQAMANTIDNIAGVYVDQKKFDRVLEFHLQALELRKQINDPKGIAESYSELGKDYLHQKNFTKALDYLLLGMKLQEEVSNKQGIADLCPSIGQLYLDQNNFTQAAFYLQKGIAIGHEMNSSQILRDCYWVLSSTYYKQHDFSEAYRYSQLYIQANDSLVNEDKNQVLLEMESKYENKEKQKEIQLLNKDKEIQQSEIGRQKILRNSFVAGLALVMIFSIVLFNRYKIIRQQKQLIETEKERSDHLLLNILPSEIAEELKRTGASQAKSYDRVTVLFTDFKNFTLASEKMTAEELVKEINFCYSAFDKIITKYGIEKIKTIGDSYMCAGGLPVENKTNPVDTVYAALEIRDFMLQRKITLANQQSEIFEIRIGIHTGPVVAGIVGIKKFAYDIWGDTVNIASRMESNSVEGKINISGTTYELIKDRFVCLSRGKLDVKNKGMIDMYFVEGIL